jgi:hypothetical protein
MSTLLAYLALGAAVAFVLTRLHRDDERPTRRTHGPTTAYCGDCPPDASGRPAVVCLTRSGHCERCGSSSVVTRGSHVHERHQRIDRQRDHAAKLAEVRRAAGLPERGDGVTTSQGVN